MAREYAIPSTSTFIQDYGLNVVPQPASRNRRVVILGTAEDGPMYEPVLVDKPEDSEIVWGRSTKGTLVRGIHECWNSQEGNPNVVGVRIGNGVKGVLDILERDSYGVAEEQPDNSGGGVVSLTLTARFPGSIYNQITVKYDDHRNVAIYNPKTGLTSVFSIDINNPNNSSVDAHNVKELADAINADSNLNSILEASVADLTADYELKVRSNTDGINQTANSVVMNLQTLLQVSGLIMGANDAYMVPVPDLPYPTDELDGNSIAKNLTVANNLVELIEIESVSNSEWEEVKFTGNTSKFLVTPLDGKGTSRWKTIQAMDDYSSDSSYVADPSGNVVSEFMYHVDNSLINEIPTDPNGLDQSGIFTINTPMPLDDSEETNTQDIATTWLQTNAATYDSYYNADTSGYERATCQGIQTKLVNNKALRPSGVIAVYVSDDIDPNGNWVQLPYCYDSGIYLSTYTDETSTKAGYCTFTFGSNAYLANSGGYEADYINDIKFTNMAMLVDGSGEMRENMYVRVDGHTVKSFLGETETLSELEAITTTVPTSYFMRGPEIVASTAPPYPMVINYGTRISFEPDTNVVLSDAVNGEISFNDSELLPGPGGNALSTSADSYIRFKYKYLPNFPLITSAVKALKKGSNGANLTVKQKEDEFKTAYNYLRDFEATVWCPMEAYIDDIKEDYNSLTGLKENMATSYPTDIEDFLEELSINSIQPHAVLGVTQIPGDTLGDRDAWVTNLTEVNIDDPIRGANVMANIGTKFISVVTYEPVMLNLGRGNPYSTNGQATYAGMLASLPYDMSPTNKAVTGVNAVRKTFSIRQLEALNAMRYVCMKVRNGVPYIVNDVTAAPYGSDFVSWSTYSITAEAADRVKRIAENYLGRPNSVELRNSMDQDIANELIAMAGLQASNFTISSTIEQQVLGVVEIDLILVPIFTMKKIRTTVKLRKSLPTGQ
jgi:hypothetical protein